MSDKANISLRSFDVPTNESILYIVVVVVVVYIFVF